ncbi:hypothetical protein J6590_091330, partial [Homalodisca vitripennis]
MREGRHVRRGIDDSHRPGVLSHTLPETWMTSHPPEGQGASKETLYRPIRASRDLVAMLNKSARPMGDDSTPWSK